MTAAGTVISIVGISSLSIALTLSGTAVVSTVGPGVFEAELHRSVSYNHLDVYKRQALYNGMPLVTTSIGAEGIVGASKVMEIVDGEREFAQSILRLYHRNDLLEKMSVNTQDFVKKYFSMDAVWESVGEDFR